MAIGWLAPVYDRRLGPCERGALGRWRERTWAAVPRDGIGLEIGAGTGANFAYYPEGARMAATDVSFRMLREAKRKAAETAPLVACDVQALPFWDSVFDWVAETLVFCEVPDPAAGLRETRRVLKPGGRLVMMEHVRPSGWMGRAADAVTALTAPLWGEHFDRNAEGFVRETGFDIKRREWLWRDGVVLLVARAPGEAP